MARIVYSLSGEGRGHATRAQTVVSMLRRHHEVLVYAPPMAFGLLTEAFAGCGNVYLRRLDALRFHYRGKRLSYTTSIAASIPFLLSLQYRVQRLVREVCNWGASHVITDFEPILPRVARAARLPLISLDHQHFLATMDPGCLPATLAWKVRFLRPSLGLFCPRPDYQLVSSYYDYPLRRLVNAAPIHKVGVLLRDAVRFARPEVGNHLVAYLRRDLTQGLRQSLKACGREVFLYGLGKLPRDGQLRFMEVDQVEFLEHLRTSAALVCSSGNQLIGEALHLRKPILAIPEVGNFEQEINGFFLPQTGGGKTINDEELTDDSVGQFLDQRNLYLDPPRAIREGNEAVQSYLSQLIGHPETESSSATMVQVNAA